MCGFFHTLSCISHGIEGVEMCVNVVGTLCPSTVEVPTGRANCPSSPHSLA